MELPQIPKRGPRCVHLHSNSMAVHGEGFADDPDQQDGLTNFWCQKTARPLGPDDGAVGMTACTNPERDCHEEY